VFIAGLPFDVKEKDVVMYFEKEMECGKLTNCKLNQFEDTKRCKGSGFLTFEDDNSAQKALKLNGTMVSWDLNNKSDDDNNDKKKKKKKGVDESKKKELRLVVKKLLNRAVTKKTNKTSSS